MTLEGLYTELATLNLPLAYHQHTEPVSVPFLVYRFDGSDDLMADNQNYAAISDITIELYCNKKDLVSEALVEDKLKDLRLPYVKHEVWVETEELFMTLYEVTII